MKKTLAFALLAALLMLAACSPSPVAITIGKHKIDMSEYAFYLYYNRLNLESTYGYVSESGVFGSEVTEQAKADALDSVVTAEVVLIKCKEYGLTLTREEKKQLKDDKKGFIEQLGGMAAFVDFLRESALTDRMYDKFHQSTLYYDKLYDYVTGRSLSMLTDDMLRRYFFENYISVKYIRITLLTDDGEYLNEYAMQEMQSYAQELLESARAGADFDELILANSDDLQDKATIVNRQDARSVAFLEPAFALAEGEVGGLYYASDACYIVKRLVLDPKYFEDNHQAIRQNYADVLFGEQLAQWKEETPVTTSGVYDTINLDNVLTFVK